MPGFTEGQDPRDATYGPSYNVPTPPAPTPLAPTETEIGPAPARWPEGSHGSRGGLPSRHAVARASPT
jgi:hypothetical protein